jgi:RimJ/RimL family protein N-acetyltransferase
MKLEIRDAKPADSSSLLKYLEKLLSEPDHNGPLLAGEFNRTNEEQIKIIESFQSEPNSVCFIAEQNNEIVGEINLRGNQRKALQHCAVLGMSVDREHRGKGIGTKLLSHALVWATNSKIIERLELVVLTTNLQAIDMYRRAGFAEEGIRRKAIKFGASNYIDDILMAKFV